MRSPHKQRSDLTLQLAADDRGSERPTWRCRDRLSLSFAWLAPPNRGSLNSAHIHGTHVPVEEPSTASTADEALNWNGRLFCQRSSSGSPRASFCEREVLYGRGRRAAARPRPIRLSR